MTNLTKYYIGYFLGGLTGLTILLGSLALVTWSLVELFLWLVG